MLDPLGISFGGLGGDTQRKKEIDDQPVACADPFGERPSRFREKHAAIGARCCYSVPRQPGDGFDDGGMRDAQAAGDIGWTRLACHGQQVRDEFDIVLKQG